MDRCKPIKTLKTRNQAIKTKAQRTCLMPGSPRSVPINGICRRKFTADGIKPLNQYN